MNDQTFSVLYCEKHGITQEQFAKSLLVKTLYPHARFLRLFIRLARPRHFASDIEFVQNVAPLRRYREFFVEADAFSYHPENRGFLRAVLNLRVSSRRMRRIVRETLHPEADLAERPEDASQVPFQRRKTRPRAGHGEPKKIS